MCIRLGTRQLLTHWHYTWPHGTGISTYAQTQPLPSHTHPDLLLRERECVCLLPSTNVDKTYNVLLCKTVLAKKKKWRLARGIERQKRRQKISLLFFKPTSIVCVCCAHTFARLGFMNFIFHLPHLKTIKFFWYFLNGYFLEHTPQPTTISKSGVVRMLLHSCSARKILVMTAPPSLSLRRVRTGEAAGAAAPTPPSPHTSYWIWLHMKNMTRFWLAGDSLQSLSPSEIMDSCSPRVVVITQAHIFISRCVRWKEGKESNVLWSYEYDRLGITTTATRERGESYALSGPQDRSLREREKVTFSYF